MSGAWYGITVIAIAAVIRWYLIQENGQKTNGTTAGRPGARHNM